MGEIEGRAFAQIQEQIMPHIDLVNISCGFHSGNEKTIRDTMQLALQYGKSIGAHPGYDDWANFGRKPVLLPPNELKDLLNRQWDRFQFLAYQESVEVKHVKAHGALYHHLCDDPDAALLFLDWQKERAQSTTIIVRANSHLEKLCQENQFHHRSELFADRRYTLEGSLVDRSQADALITDPSAMIPHVARLLEDYGDRQITFCLHSDTESSIELVKALRVQLYHLRS